VLAVSRLHRLCKRNNVPETLIPDLCGFKTRWATWWLTERDNIDRDDYFAMRSEAADLLRAHSAAGLAFGALVKEAKELAKKYEPALTSSRPVTGDVVLGLLISLAVEAEA
jgi:hypothetical protein